MKLIRNPNVNVLYGGSSWVITRRSSQSWSRGCLMSKSWTTQAVGPIPVLFRNQPVTGCFFSTGWSTSEARSQCASGVRVGE